MSKSKDPSNKDPIADLSRHMRDGTFSMAEINRMVKDLFRSGKKRKKKVRT